jgi:hypothetical protein
VGRVEIVAGGGAEEATDMVLAAELGDLFTLLVEEGLHGCRVLWVGAYVIEGTYKSPAGGEAFV